MRVVLSTCRPGRFRFHLVLCAHPGCSSAEHLHETYFKGLPDISKKPDFLEFSKKLPRSSGFPVLDPDFLMQPYAESKLFHFTTTITSIFAVIRWRRILVGARQSQRRNRNLNRNTRRIEKAASLWVRDLKVGCPPDNSRHRTALTSANPVSKQRVNEWSYS